MASAVRKEYKLLVRENEMVSQKFKVKVAAESMDELEEAIAARAQAAGMEIDRNFIVCPWDDDFDEYVDGVKWKDFPQTGKVELREKEEADEVVEAEADIDEEDLAFFLEGEGDPELESESEAEAELKSEPELEPEPEPQLPQPQLEPEPEPQLNLTVAVRPGSSVAKTQVIPRRPPPPKIEPAPELRLEEASSESLSTEASVRSKLAPAHVVCPEDAGPGDIITVLLDAGGKSEIDIEIPAGVQPGDAFQVEFSSDGEQRVAATRRLDAVGSRSPRSQGSSQNAGAQPVATVRRLEQLSKTPEHRMLGKASATLDRAGRRVGGSVGSQAAHCTFVPKINATPSAGRQATPTDDAACERVFDRLSKPRVPKAPPTEPPPLPSPQSSRRRRSKPASAAAEGEPPSLYEREKQREEARRLRLQQKKELMEKEEFERLAERSVHKKSTPLSREKQEQRHLANVERWAELDRARIKKAQEKKAKLDYEADLADATASISNFNSIRLPAQSRADVVDRLNVVKTRIKPQQRTNRRLIMSQSAPRERIPVGTSTWGPPKADVLKRPQIVDTNSLPSPQVRGPANMRSWSKGKVLKWLQAVKMPVYVPVFKLRNVDGAQLVKLAMHGRAGAIAASRIGIEPIHHVKMIALVQRELKYATFSEQERDPDVSLRVEMPWSVAGQGISASGPKQKALQLSANMQSDAPPPSPTVVKRDGSEDMSPISSHHGTRSAGPTISVDGLMAERNHRKARTATSARHLKRMAAMFKWLDSIGLSQYYEMLNEDGYDDLALIASMDDTEVRELIHDLRIPVPDSRTLRHAISDLRRQGRCPSLPGSPTIQELVMSVGEVTRKSSREARDLEIQALQRKQQQKRRWAQAEVRAAKREEDVKKEREAGLAKALRRIRGEPEPDPEPQLQPEPDPEPESQPEPEPESQPKPIVQALREPSSKLEPAIGKPDKFGVAAEPDRDTKKSKTGVSYVQRFNMSVKVPSLAVDANSSQRRPDDPSRAQTVPCERESQSKPVLQKQANADTMQGPKQELALKPDDRSRDRNQSQKLFDEFEEKSVAFEKLAAEAADQVSDVTSPQLSPGEPDNKLTSQSTDLETSPTPMLRVLAAVEAAGTEAAEASKTQQVAPTSTEDALMAADKALEALDSMPLSDRYGLIATPLELSGRPADTSATDGKSKMSTKGKRKSLKAYDKSQIVVDTSAAAVSMSKGNRVKVFSASANDWLSGVVEEINDSGEAQVRYRV
eukprot:COSAG02_NODE_2756_length_8084_cov_3.879649_1_plen_1242_part_10